MLKRVGLLVREKLVYGTALRALCGLSSHGYTLVKVRVDDRVFSIYTHYEGLQVIHEVLYMRTYWRALELKPRVVVDVGAHVGTFTLLATHSALKAHGDAHVVSVEPVSVNYRALLNNIEINGLRRYVVPFKFAVAARPGIAEVEWLGIRERVRTSTMYEIIDSIRERSDRIDIVNMDIEGAELEVLTENNDWLKYVDALVMELHPWIYGIRGLLQILRALAEAGFRVTLVETLVDSRRALIDSTKTLHPSPVLLTLMPWWTLVAFTLRHHTLRYWLAVRSH